ncbi:hypothetical protein C8F01DRAFT_1112899 [Mycena amicta]|nr:hypothetical protein C8F01DRAFT_1112899 [Mycena amicta]
MSSRSALLALAAPSTYALTISTITGNFVIGGVIHVAWTTSSSDAAGSFSVELVHPSFNRQYALANNVDSSSLSKDIELPVVDDLGDGYTLEFVGISDINTVYTVSDDFSIGAENTTTTHTVHGSTIKTTSTPISTPSTPSTTVNSATTTPLGPGTSTGGTSTVTSASNSDSGSGPSTPSGTSGAMPMAVANYFAGSVPAAMLVALGVVAGAVAL